MRNRLIPLLLASCLVTGHCSALVDHLLLLFAAGA